MHTYSQKELLKPGVVAHIYNFCGQEAEEEGLITSSRPIWVLSNTLTQRGGALN